MGQVVCPPVQSHIAMFEALELAEDESFRVQIGWEQNPSQPVEAISLSQLMVLLHNEIRLQVSMV